MIDDSKLDNIISAIVDLHPQEKWLLDPFGDNLEIITSSGQSVATVKLDKEVPFVEQLRIAQHIVLCDPNTIKTILDELLELRLKVADRYI